MDITTHTTIEDLAEWTQRVKVFPGEYPGDRPAEPFVVINLDNHGSRLIIDSPADADELISWATAARDYLTLRPA